MEVMTVVSYTNMVQKIAPTTAVAGSEEGRKVRSIRLKVSVKNATGDLYITDMMLQSGSIATGWTGHVSEIQFTQDG